MSLAPLIGGRGSPTSSSGDDTIGLPGGHGAIVSGCNGGGGGVGVGGGPGAINNGGHGRCYNAGISLFGGYSAQSLNNGLTPGVVGKNGLVKIVW